MISSSALPAIALPLGLFLGFWVLCYTPLAGVLLVMKCQAKRGSAWLAKRSTYAPILLVMAVGVVATVCAGWLFVELAEQVRLNTSLVNRADQVIHAWFGQERRPAMIVLLSGVTSLGGGVGLGALAGVVVAILLVRKERASATFVTVTAMGGALLNLGLKMLFTRARPDLTEALTSSRYYSFPSGHAMGSFVTLGAVVYIVSRQAWPWRVKSACLALALTLVALVGLSRVYLGVHWASDIAGGWSAGAVWLCAAVVAFEMLLRLRQRRRGAAPSSTAAEVPDRPVRA